VLLAEGQPRIAFQDLLNASASITIERGHQVREAMESAMRL
jgi:hypothetical protein